MGRPAPGPTQRIELGGATDGQTAPRPVRRESMEDIRGSAAHDDGRCSFGYGASGI